MPDIRRSGEFGDLVKCLRWLEKFLKTLHISSSTKKTYGSSHKIFLQFCEDFEVDPLTISEQDLGMAVIHYVMGHSVNGAPSYVSGIQNLFDSHDQGPLPRGPGFLLLMKGLNRILTAPDKAVKARALSLHDVMALVVAADEQSKTDVVFCAQVIVAFFLALRTEDHTGGRLLWGDVFMQEDGSVDFLIPPGKSVKVSRHVSIAARADCLDAALWLNRLFRLLPPRYRSPVSPVFVQFQATNLGGFRCCALTRKAFVDILKTKVSAILGCEPVLFSGYSLRRGGATAMVTSQVPLPAVNSHVGWAPTSRAVFGYFDPCSGRQRQLPTAMLVL